MSKMMPTLSHVGWTRNTAEKLDFALAHFFESEETQTYLFPGQIADVHSIIARNVHDNDALIVDMASLLTQYLRTLFDHAEVEGVNISKEKNDPKDRIEIAMRIRVKDEENQIMMQRFVNYEFNRFKSITEVSNYGVRA